MASNLTEELRYEARLENAKKPDALKRVIIWKIGGYEKDGQFNEATSFSRWSYPVYSLLGSMEFGKQPLLGNWPTTTNKRAESHVDCSADTFRAGAVAQPRQNGDAA